MNSRHFWVVFAVVALCCSGCLCSDFIELDRCLDNGGRWDDEKKICKWRDSADKATSVQEIEKPESINFKHEKPGHKKIRSKQTGVTMVLPNDSWEPIFFQAINRETTDLDMQPLREKKVPKQSMELRIWIGFGGDKYLEGVVLKKNKSKWQGKYVGRTESNRVNSLTPPSSGWDKLWSDLQGLNITTLPDSSDLGPGNMVEDGVSFVFELLTHDTYRTYHYSNPRYDSWPQSQNVLNIDATLRREFNLKQYAGGDRPEWFHEKVTH